jgi:hypothetical protein
MAGCFDEHVPSTGPLRFVDLGSRQVKGQSLSHRALFDRDGCE